VTNPVAGVAGQIGVMVANTAIDNLMEDSFLSSCWYLYQKTD